MIHIPVLRWGEPYKSLESDKVVHFGRFERQAFCDGCVCGCFGSGSLLLNCCQYLGSTARALFQPFASDRPGGVGLGLALAHRIVSLHGGTLVLEPRAGGGTTARITFAKERFAVAAAARSPDAQRR